MQRSSSAAVCVDGLTLLLFVVGLGCLIGGAEVLVRGASRLAITIGISPLVVGLTIVAFGTSAPELAVTVQASLAGQPDVALGNVVGSNIANVLLILGLSSLITSLAVAQQLVRLDIPIMIGVSVLLLLLALDGRVGRLDGLLLFAGIIAYTTFAIRQSRKESRAVEQEYQAEFGTSARGQVLLNLALVAAGLVLIVLGARWLVNGAVAVARLVGVSELVIGLTIVAVGTSLPEVATSLIASLRGERDIAVGNVVGSNIFNIMAVLGLGSALAPGGVPVAPAALRFDIPVMIAVAVACLPIFARGYVIARWQGLLFLFYYAAYTLYLLLAAVQHDALPVFSRMMLLFVLPLTALTLAVVALRTIRANRQQPAV